MSEISRERYASLYGPTVGDRVRLADTNLWLEVEEDRCGYGEEAVFGGGKTIRESMAQGSTTHAAGRAGRRDHERRRARPLGRREGRRRHPRRADRRAREGGQPGHHGRRPPGLRIGPTTDVIAGEGRILTAGGVDCHVHFISPTIVTEALASGITTLIGGGTGPTEGTRATTCTPSPLEPGDDAPRARRPTGQHRAAREGQHGQRRRPGRAGAGRRGWLQAPRGLGLDAGGDRRLPAGGRAVRRAGGDPHRHAQRGGLPRVDGRGDRRPANPQLPHRGRRRWARAGHHRDRVPAQRPAVVDQPDPAALDQHGGRAPRHADRLPPPQPEGAGGPGLRREPDPREHDGGRGPPARHRRDLDHRLGLAGDGPGG